MKIEIKAVSGRHPAAPVTAPAALRAATLSVASGEQVAVIGPSGAGKTTLLHLMACAMKPSGGELQLAQVNPWSLPRRKLQQLRGQLFLAPQVPPLPPRQRVVTAVLAGRLPHEPLWASVRSLFYPTDIALAERALAGFDMQSKLFERVDRLSGGERQRVGLARAFASRASLMLVDEPLSALDPTRSLQAIQTLTRMASERQATLVATLHHVQMALDNFPRIIGLREGEVAFDLPTQAVTADRLQDLYAQHLDELHGPAAAEEAATIAPEPAARAASAVPMNCR